MMSKKERKERQQVREMLRSEGILPPKKKPLNRKKFAEEVLAVLHSDQRPDVFSISTAVMRFSPLYKDGKILGKVSDGELMALKIIKVAIEHESFLKEVKERGDTSYTIGEYYEKVHKKIFDL